MNHGDVNYICILNKLYNNGYITKDFTIDLELDCSSVNRATELNETYITVIIINLTSFVPL